MKVKKNKGLAAAGLAVCMMLGSTTGCDKQAEVVSGYEEVSTEGTSAEEGKKTEEKDSKDNKSQSDKGSENSAEPEYWTEKLSCSDGPFESVNIKAKIKDNTGAAGSIITVETGDYDQAFIESTCKQVFGDSVEVYDYSNKTKRLYDSEIAMYEALKAMYLDENAGLIIEALPGEEEPGPDAYENMLNNVDKVIADLQSERDAAPDTVENDYSYGGYIGEIEGASYYMYFGNCNLNQYVQAPYSMNMNGRQCTIFRENPGELYDGMYGCSYDYMPIEGNASPMDVPENIISEAEKFVEAIGFTDYKYTDDKSYGYVYRKGVDGVITYGTDLPYTQYSKVGPDDIQKGYTVKFTFDGIEDRDINYEAELFKLNVYADDLEIMDINSYITVMVTEKGDVLGCQLVNPMKVMKEEQTEKLLTTYDIKDIIIDNVDNADAWNIPKDFSAVSIELNQLKLINFPLRSRENKGEYTYVPAYILYNSGNTDTAARNVMVEGAGGGVQITTGPCMIINAVDGSFIKVKDELSDPFDGYKRGNEGYKLYDNGGWERYQIIRDHMNRWNTTDDEE